MESIETINRLIEKGIGIELISLELDIPIEELKKVKQKYEKSKAEKSSTKEKVNKQTTGTHIKSKASSQLDIIREKYMKMYKKKYNTPVEKKEKEESDEHKAEIDTAILNIERIINEINNMQPTEKYDKKSAKFLTILKEINRIKEFQFTLEQAQKLSSLLEVTQIKYLSKNKIDMIMMMQKIVLRKLVDAVDEKVIETEDIEELKKLSQNINNKVMAVIPLASINVIEKIDNKILLIQKQNRDSMLINKIEPSIENIIMDLAKGTIDISKAKEIISREAKRRTENAPKTKFALTDKQQEKQILYQIRKRLSEKPEQYEIVDPQTIVLKLQELSGQQLDIATRTVVSNLIGNKRFLDAKELCDKVSKMKIDNKLVFLSIQKQKDIIRNAELGDIILRVLKEQPSKEADEKYYKLIEDGLKKENVKPRSIQLGTNEDGTRNITLADIWNEERLNEKVI